MSNPARKYHSTLLLCSGQEDAMAISQAAIFNSAGYPVILALTLEQIERHIKTTAFDIAVLNHTLSFTERKSLADRIKAIDPGISILVLHSSGALGNPNADIAIDSRLGPAAILRALKRIDLMQWLRQRHSRVEDEYLVIVDENRNYLFASDAACRLLGYDRVQFLELRIDDVVAGAKETTEPLFSEFVRSGTQTGTIVLRHRSGRLIDVQYAAEVGPDGSLLARWFPLPPPQSPRESKPSRHQ